jgi:hypothetical protein
MDEMMNQQGGLSTMGVEAPTEAPVQGGQEGQGITIEDVVHALMNGISPEELVKSGVPVEMVKEAIMMIQQQSQGEGMAHDTSAQGGLSQMGMQ